MDQNEYKCTTKVLKEKSNAEIYLSSQVTFGLQQGHIFSCTSKLLEN
jgi:hypothetical protein